jgi:voltage-gated potassium channel
MHKSIRRVQHTLGPAVFAALVILLAVIAITTIGIFLFEHGENPKAGTLLSVVNWAFLTVVTSSPWPLMTAGGKILAYVVVVMKPISIAVITAAVTSQLFQWIVRRSSGMGRTRAKNHILICGWSSKGAEIIREIRNRSDLAADETIVILAPLPASPTKDPLSTFIHGDPTNAADLKRAGVLQADTAIVLADNSYPDIDAEQMDSRTLIATLAIESLNPTCYTCVEVVHSGNRQHFNRTRADELVVSAHLTGALLAHSAVTRGLSKVIDDLLTYPEGDEFYWTDLPPSWAGMTFSDLMMKLKQELDCLLLAVARSATYVTNPPKDYLLEKGDRLLVIAHQNPALG